MNALTLNPQLYSLPNSYGELETIYRHTLGNPFGSLAILGPNGGEGCTSLILAMASRTAAAGTKVLVLELNFATPTLAQYLNRKPAHWDLQTPTAELPIIEHAIGDIDLLPAPLQVDSIHQFREPRALQRLLQNLKQIYTKVLIDCSPVNRQNRNNLPAEMVAAESDSTLLLALAGHSQESELLEAKDRLNRCAANLLGCVINDREFPGLACELIRETRRFDRYLPKTMEGIRQMISNSGIINQRI